MFCDACLHSMSESREQSSIQKNKKHRKTTVGTQHPQKSLLVWEAQIFKYFLFFSWHTYVSQHEEFSSNTCRASQRFHNNNKNRIDPPVSERSLLSNFFLCRFSLKCFLPFSLPLTSIVHAKNTLSLSLCFSCSLSHRKVLLSSCMQIIFMSWKTAGTKREREEEERERGSEGETAGEGRKRGDNRWRQATNGPGAEQWKRESEGVRERERERESPHASFSLLISGSTLKPILFKLSQWAMPVWKSWSNRERERVCLCVISQYTQHANTETIQKPSRETKTKISQTLRQTNEKTYTKTCLPHRNMLTTQKHVYNKLFLSTLLCQNSPQTFLYLSSTFNFHSSQPVDSSTLCHFIRLPATYLLNHHIFDRSLKHFFLTW